MRGPISCSAGTQGCDSPPVHETASGGEFQLRDWAPRCLPLQSESRVMVGKKIQASATIFNHGDKESVVIAEFRDEDGDPFFFVGQARDHWDFRPIRTWDKAYAIARELYGDFD